MRPLVTPPVIPLDAANLCSRSNVAIVQAWMLYPDSAEMRDDHIRHALVVEGIEHHAAGRLDDQETAALLATALDIPSTKEIRARADRRAEMAVAAGMLFYNGAIRIAKGGKSPLESVKLELRRALWGKGATNSNHIDEVVLKRYRPVMALWAAWIDIDDGDGEYIQIPCSPPELAHFIAWADAFRRLGERTIPKHKKHPILSPNETVRFPDAVLAVLPPGELVIGNTNEN